MHIIDKARIFAMAAHAAVGQRRKYTNEHYFAHHSEVAQIVGEALLTSECTIVEYDNAICAAYLHDVVEDTKVSLNFIKLTFGKEIANLVDWLTDASRPQDGNRATRKAIDREHISKAPTLAKTIKLADLISNTKTIVAHDSTFAKVYMAEKKLLLEVLKEGDETLYAQASAIVEDYYANL